MGGMSKAWPLAFVYWILETFQCYAKEQSHSGEVVGIEVKILSGSDGVKVKLKSIR